MELQPKLTFGPLLIVTLAIIVNIVNINGAMLDPVNNFECPPLELISPCLCSPNYGGSVECRGPEVAQETLNQLFYRLRTVNNISQEDWLSISRLTVTNTLMTQVDLSPLFRSHFNRYIHIYDNPKLWKISGTKYFHQRGILVDEVMFTQNALTDVGLNDTLSYFEPLTLKKLALGSNKLRGGQVIETSDDEFLPSVEFLPGSNNLKNLEEFDLNNNLITRIAGGQFKGNSKLQELNLQKNEIKELGRNAFLFDFISIPSHLKLINLSDNRLKDDKIHYKSGIKNFSGPTKINFNGNLFQFISPENFEIFLQANSQNQLEFWDNQFTCDLRLRWLKEGREEFDYDKKVKGIKCSNDPSKSPFNTESIY